MYILLIYREDLEEKVKINGNEGIVLVAGRLVLELLLVPPCNFC